MEEVKAWLLGRLDQLSAWIGLIGLILLVFGFHTILAFLFIILVVFPDTEFSSLVKRGAAWVRGL